ncbi:MAG: hypothetical protein V4628_13820 [Pseudomonadota bacterium]
MIQAVVLIHGIGEQKPMDTVRGFVEAVLPPAEDGTEQYFSKPDPLSESFELRRLQAVGRNKIHFFEYYWAYQTDGTTVRHVTQWLIQLLLRRPRNVPPGLRTVWGMSWFLLLALVIAAALGLADKALQFYELGRSYWWVSLGLVLLLGLLQGFLIHYVGDAARYLSPSPQNIALRQRIRSEGVNLLRRLHESGKYDRIVIVGHSLGSVIGYDILTALWQKHNENYDFKAREDLLDSLMAANRRPQPILRDALSTLGETLRNLPNNVAGTTLHRTLLQAFRTAQHLGFKEQCMWGNTWRITDFITIGSPLAHAMMLLARNGNEFAARKRQRELATCPPIVDSGRYAYATDERVVTAAGRTFSPFVLHHAACFGVTQWTNLYFPAHAGFFGDVVGGPLADVFGAGIKDVRVTSKSRWRFTLAAHTSYWNPQASQSERSEDQAHEQFALDELKQALRFDRARDFKAHISVADEDDRDELVKLNKDITAHLLEGAVAKESFAGILADQLQYYRSGEQILGKKGFIEHLDEHKLAGMPTHEGMEITFMGRLALVNVTMEFKSADAVVTRTSDIRIFARANDSWLLETWCSNVQRSSKA